MIKIKGQYNEAHIFSGKLMETAIDQIKELLDQEFIKDSKVRIMPDFHSGKGCVIGTTMTIADKVVPNLVGVDVGCGILTVKLQEKDIDFAKLDETIRTKVPSGSFTHQEDQDVITFNSNDFRAKSLLSNERINRSLGTLGGGK